MAGASTVFYTSLINPFWWWIWKLSWAATEPRCCKTHTVTVSTGSWEQTRNSIRILNTPLPSRHRGNGNGSAMAGLHPCSCPVRVPTAMFGSLSSLSLSHQPSIKRKMRLIWHLFLGILDLSAVPIMRSFCCNIGKILVYLRRVKEFTTAFMWQPDFQVPVP